MRKADDVKKIWGLNLPGTPWACSGLLRETLNCNMFRRCSVHNKNDFATHLAFENNYSSYVSFQALKRNVRGNLSCIVEQPARLSSELSMFLEVGPDSGISV